GMHETAPCAYLRHVDMGDRLSDFSVGVYEQKVLRTTGNGQLPFWGEFRVVVKRWKITCVVVRHDHLIAAKEGIQHIGDRVAVRTGSHADEIVRRRVRGATSQHPSARQSKANDGGVICDQKLRLARSKRCLRTQG